ncbi:MAG: homocysteine S-methyltransferase family protein [Planctomycetaceae bacterium]|nr:homocysteine S-methyltransferase family protein [Planctomycetaceae bacterium]
MVSFVCGHDGRLFSGESLTKADEAVLPYDPLAVLVNCLPAETAEQCVRELVGVAVETPVGVYVNVGWLGKKRGGHREFSTGSLCRSGCEMVIVRSTTCWGMLRDHADSHRPAARVDRPIG